MATKKETPAVEEVDEIQPEVDRSEEYVDFMIPLGADSTPVFIGVNGENVRVRPGEQVSIKRKFVEAYNNSVKQTQAAYKAQRAAEAASRKALADL